MFIHKHECGETTHENELTRSIVRLMLCELTNLQLAKDLEVLEDHLAMFDEDRRNAWKEIVERAMKLTGLSLPPTPGAQEIVSLLKSLCFDYHQIFIQ